MANDFTIQHGDIYCGNCNKGITFDDALNHVHFDFKAIVDEYANSGTHDGSELNPVINVDIRADDDAKPNGGCDHYPDADCCAFYRESDNCPCPCHTAPATD